jgi:hypothetical protein
MVIRVPALILSFFVCIPFLFMTNAAAGGAPFAPAPAYQCAPPVCGPPDCGPRPFGLGACLNICSAICGTVLGCPARVASAILDPPPPIFPRRRAFCGPAGCPPPLYPPQVCAPPPVRPITKVKPAAVAYPPPPPVACGPAPVPFRMAPGCGPRPPVLGCGALCGALLSMPFRLCSGLLSVSDGPLGPVAGVFDNAFEAYNSY